MQTNVIPNKSVMVEDGSDEDDDDHRESTQRSAPAKLSPVAKTFQANTIIPNKSTMVEEPADDESDTVDDNRRRISTIAPSTIASTKSMSPPVFKSNAFANANGTRDRSISPPPKLPKSVAQVEEEERKEQEIRDKMDEYEDKIEALKERIVELQEDLKVAHEKLRAEQSKPLPSPPPSNDGRLMELEMENERLKEELREQGEVMSSGNCLIEGYQ
jgi:hypothetical protein